jgi:hypothetical protein
MATRCNSIRFLLTQPHRRCGSGNTIFEKPVPATEITTPTPPRSDYSHEHGGVDGFAGRLVARREFCIFAA